MTDDRVIAKEAMTPEERLVAAESFNDRLLDLAIKCCSSEISLMGALEDEARSNDICTTREALLSSLYISDAIDEACRRNRIGMYALMDELGVSDERPRSIPTHTPPLRVVK